MNDAQYVSWFVHHINGDQKGIYENSKLIDFHLCDEHDYAEFYEPRSQDKTVLDFIKENDGLYCLDREQEKDIFINSGFSSSNYQEIFIGLWPCNGKNLFWT